MSTLTFYTLYFAIFNTLQVALCMQDFNLHFDIVVLPHLFTWLIYTFLKDALEIQLLQ